MGERQQGGGVLRIARKRECGGGRGRGWDALPLEVRVSGLQSFPSPPPTSLFPLLPPTASAPRTTAAIDETCALHPTCAGRRKELNTGNREQCAVKAKHRIGRARITPCGSSAIMASAAKTGSGLAAMKAVHQGLSTRSSTGRTVIKNLDLAAYIVDRHDVTNWTSASKRV